MSENHTNTKWFSISRPDHGALQCPVCGDDVALEPMADHHPRCCPGCKVESAFLNWKSRIVMIVPNRAPAPLRDLLRWMQDNLDELGYVEIICGLEELSDAMQCNQVTD